ncbi:MAG: glycoside hydrolase family 2 protein [Lentisphaeria bacterium]|nr:glycoside hydrolase family 2 protein [Lentisphaeria bacterium]
MRIVTLDGIWDLMDGQGDFSLAAQVPGDVTADLLNAGKIPDPFYRENEVDIQWIGERDWIYERAFDVSETLLTEERVLLQCDGLDTLATVEINGREVGTGDNMHRAYEWDVKAMLRPGANTIRVTFASANVYTRERHEQRPFRARVGESHPSAYPGWIRKEASNFGWDWGPILVTAGIWRGIRLAAFSTARIGDIRIDQEHSGGGVTLNVFTTVDAAGGDALTARVTALFKGKTVDSKDILTTDSDTLSLTIPNPSLWWPAGMGGQPLYDVRVELLSGDGEVVDSQTKRVGLRTLVLDRHDDEWGESFQFVVNGVPFFAKGANWIPADAILARRTPQLYRQLIEDAAAANMNMLRVWGGGIYEEDYFYDICDELGICVWQDFMFACMSYPTFDDAFMKTVEAEARDNVKRLRHHPSIALWCGNNELEQQAIGETWTLTRMSLEDYKRLFDDLLADVARELDPQRDYWPSSPHSPRGERTNYNNPDCGDAHLWDVWHGKKPFEWYRTAHHRFCSEFGFQSFPEPKTVRGYTEPRDRNVTTAVMEHHQRSGIGNTTIMQYMLDWFRMPTAFDMTLRASQILQGMAITYAVEHWRRGMPRSMGALYWQHNDCWPVASWASIDYHGRWKALHYMARHFFAPLLVSGVEDLKNHTVDVHVTSDLQKSLPATLTWVATDVAGGVLDSGETRVRTPVNGNLRALTIDLKKVVKQAGKRNVMVWLELSAEGRERCVSLVTFVKPKHLELATDPGVSMSVTETGEAFRVTLKTKRPALWAWLELDNLEARFSDNYLHLRPARTVTIDVTPGQPVTLDEVKEKISVHSLVDTYRTDGR